MLKIIPLKNQTASGIHPGAVLTTIISPYVTGKTASRRPGHGRSICYVYMASFAYVRIIICHRVMHQAKDIC